jgi:hypothetical protein
MPASLWLSGIIDQDTRTAIPMVSRVVADLKPGVFDAPLRGCGA